ncbi:hypothetical protein CORC01_05073 [Colletotrichum orchidophilum]|uniref:Uncharacterized protein n=1 Tax=Colletotrichum orchidophilum TaxID=1209926 RepID=A0A1G4BEF3_9PEZI|nr:hypothetical protein CORC01_05073 [Colletotrichum orchidophilum]
MLLVGQLLGWWDLNLDTNLHSHCWL